MRMCRKESPLKSDAFVLGGALRVEDELARPGSVVPYVEGLDVQDDVGHVLIDAGERGELVVGPGDPRYDRRGAFQRGQQHTPEGGAEGTAEAAFEGGDDQPAVGACQALLVPLDAVR